MLRTKASKPISKDEEIILMANHNFFIRAAIARVAKIVLASVSYFCFCTIFATVFNNIVLRANGATNISNEVGAFSTFYMVIVVLVGIIFLAYFVYEIYEIISIHKEVTNIEDKILGHNNYD